MSGHQVSISPTQAGPDDLVIFHESCGKELQTVWRDCSVYVTINGMQLIVYDYPFSKQSELKTDLIYELELRRYNMMHVTEWFYGSNSEPCEGRNWTARDGEQRCIKRPGHDDDHLWSLP